MLHFHRLWRAKGNISPIAMETVATRCTAPRMSLSVVLGQCSGISAAVLPVVHGPLGGGRGGQT